jgi:hypothetical protein
MLGQLAVELLDGGQRRGMASKARRDSATQGFAPPDDPLKNAGPWKYSHPQLARIIRKMLDENHEARWSGMDEIVRQLKAVELEARALAKASYMTWVDNDGKFFEDFYARFFRVAGKRARDKFKDIAQQRSSLHKGMAAVLNFAPGNDPNSLRYVVAAHTTLGVTDRQLYQFRDCFLETLKNRVRTRAKGDGELAGRKQEILAAWRELFDEVISYFREHRAKGSKSVGA